MRFSRLPCLFLLLACFAGVALGASVRTEHVEAELIAANASFEPGKPLAVALRLKMIPHWHTYWRNPGDSGQPTTVEWTLPQGWSAGPILWPPPQRLPAGPFVNFGYEGEVLLLTDIAVPAHAAGEAMLTARASWLVCNEERCIPEEADLTLALPAGAGEASPAATEIAAWRAVLPVAAQEVGVWQFAAKSGSGHVDLEVVPPRHHAGVAHVLSVRGRQDPERRRAAVRARG